MGPTDEHELHPLQVRRCTDAEDVGRRAAALAADRLRVALADRPRARVMLASAPSQLATLQHLAALAQPSDPADRVPTPDQTPLDLSRVDFFHMDDYLGLPPTAPQGFARWLDEHFLGRLPGPTTFHRMEVADRPGPEAAARYAASMGAEPFDLTLCGLGVNAHLAFNDPPADFAEPEPVRVVALSHESRAQQVNEGLFPDLDAVPTAAVTVTIPRLLHATTVIVSVIGAAKHWAVEQTLARGLDPDCPGTALKLHPDVHLFVDPPAID